MPRVLTTLVILLSLATSVSASDGPADPFTGIRFTDGKSRAIADLGDQTVVMVYFCGHCPGAGKFMRTEAKAVHDLIEERKVPMQLVCVTPDLTPQALVDWAKSNGLENALIGEDTLNIHRIGLKNILQQRYYGKGQSIQLGSFGKPFLDNVRGHLDQGNVGSFRFPVDGLSDEKSKALWWMVERDKPQAMGALLAARKNKSLKDDAEKIYAVVEASLTKRQDTLLSAGTSMATYEGLEALLTQAKPITLKPASDKLKELGKDATIKNELKARAIYQQCQEMIANPNPQKQQAGREGLETLAKKYGETLYGKKAAGK